MSSAQGAKAQLVHAAFHVVSGRVGVKLCVCVCVLSFCLGELITIVSRYSITIASIKVIVFPFLINPSNPF